MIPFNARKTNHETMFFFARQNLNDFTHVLAENCITGYHLDSLTEIQHMLPHNTNIPMVYVSRNDTMPVPVTDIQVFASKYDPNDLKELLWTILEHPETAARHQAMQKYADKMTRWEKAFQSDPSPWGDIPTLRKPTEMQYSVFDLPIKSTRMFNIIPSKKTTYFFFKQTDEQKLMDILFDNLVTGWGVYTLPVVQDKLPKDVKIPDFVSPLDAKYGIKLKPAGIRVLVSRFDPDKLQALMESASYDPKTLAVQRAVRTILAKAYQTDEKWANDPDPWSLGAGFRQHEEG